MRTDLVCRIIGVILILISILMLLLISDISEIGAGAAGFFMGLGLGFLASGENVLLFWKSIIKG